MKKERILSGMRPTGKLHLGNLFGVLKNWVGLQDQYECFFMVADYHCLTTPSDFSQIQENTIAMVADWLAVGVEPQKSIIFVQSLVPEHAELALLLGMFTPLGWLLRCPTYKEQIREYPDYQNYGLLGYPVLQAADILIYKAKKVPVGLDQLPHLEITREIARAFNHHVGKIFPEPQPLLSEAPKIMGLNRPNEKMSKSFGPDNCLYLADEPETIRVKIQKAVTDVGPSNKMGPAVANLFTLMKQVSSEETYQLFYQKYQKKELKYQKLKEVLASDLIEYLKPIQKKRKEWIAHPEKIRQVLLSGSEKARKIAQETIKEVRFSLGLRL
jgi:tryptophanyl-tRNA synthetase